jgi:hypothetical protein
MINKLFFFIAFSVLVISCGQRDRESPADREGMVDRLEALEASLSGAEKVL